MKTSNRVHGKSNITNSKQQADGASPSRAAICVEARAAFAEFDHAACAAIALAQLNANHIERSIRENAGWADLESATFLTGNEFLPRLVADNFTSEFREWRDAMSKMAGKIEAGLVAGSTEPEIKGEIEYFIHAIDHVLIIQGNEIDRRNKATSYGCDIIVRKRLEAAWDRARNACHALASLVRAGISEPVRQAA